MFLTKVFSALPSCKLYSLLWIIVTVQLSTGKTTCGWIFRDGLLNPNLSQFNSTFNLTAVPVVNTNQAWCIPVKNHSLTVDLGSVTNVTGLAVQGEDGTNNYVTSYEVDYSQDGKTFVNIKNGLKPQCSAKEFFGAFPGSSNGSDIAENNVTIPFLARYVRFRPQESVGRLCTRVDVRGCQSDNGFSEWSIWSSCDAVPPIPPTTSGCARLRRRVCERKLKGCRGPLSELGECDSNKCPRECGELGVTDENRSINDTAFSASTFKQGFEPHKARLNGPSAWCALVNDQQQYLEVDLGGEAQIKEIKTQGFQSGNRSAWVTQFFLDTRRTDNSEWEDYTENSSVRVYDANVNGRMVRTYTLADVPTARYIRFYPLVWKNEICMRVSVSGCRADQPRVNTVVAKEKKVDRAFWILLWVLLGLLLLLLLLGLLYLCCRYCPCCACCGCCPCVKKRKVRRTDEAMMTELTSDEIDAGRVHVATGATQTDGGLAETETQTLAIHLGSEDGRRAGTGAVFFSRQEGDAQDTSISHARYNEAFKLDEKHERVSSSHVSTASHRAGMVASATAGATAGATARSHDQVDSARVGGLGIDQDRMAYEERLRSSQYERGTMASYQGSSRAVSDGGQYLGRYEVETLYPGQTSVRRHPLGPPPVIALEVSPQYEDNTWRVERIEQVDDRMAYGAMGGDRAGGSGLQYSGIGYRGVEDRARSAAVEASRFRGNELQYKESGWQGVDDSERTITVHLGDVVPERLDASELEARAARERYYNQDTYRARPRREIETWRVDCIRGLAFEGTVDTGREPATGQPYQYQAPVSPTSSDISSISQFNGSSVSEQFGDSNSRKQKFYKMFEYSHD